jgi:hypothetical protein
MYESGMIAPSLGVQSEEEADDESDDDPDSWFTLEERRQFKENRRRLEEEARKNPPKRSLEERLQILRNFPVASEEDIKRQEEASKHLRQWTIREWEDQ